MNLENWIKKSEINHRPYYHKLGEKEKSYKRIESSEILLIEGLFSMDKLLLSYIDFSIFIFTTNEYLKKIRLEADIKKRNYTK